jgi:hypothetical protein
MCTSWHCAHHDIGSSDWFLFGFVQVIVLVYPIFFNSSYYSKFRSFFLSWETDLWFQYIICEPFRSKEVLEKLHVNLWEIGVNSDVAEVCPTMRPGGYSHCEVVWVCAAQKHPFFRLFLRSRDPHLVPISVPETLLFMPNQFLAKFRSKFPLYWPQNRFQSSIFRKF